jgi:hypothetical protein
VVIKHKETQRNTKKHKETQRNTEKHKETQRNTKKHKETHFGDRPQPTKPLFLSIHGFRSRVTV